MANSRQHSELIGDDGMPVTRGHMVAMYPAFRSLWTPLATLQGLGSGTELKRPLCPVLWCTLVVGARTQHMFHRPRCEVCGALEKMSQCRCLAFAADTVLKAYGPVCGIRGAGGGGGSNV